MFAVASEVFYASAKKTDSCLMLLYWNYTDVLNFLAHTLLC